MPEFVLEDEPAGFARIKVVGVGGGGCNAVDSMFDLGLQNVEFFVINSDLQALKRSKCPNRIQIGAELTKGRGCGADPKLGERCMEDAHDLMVETLQSADIVFVTAGLGGGTGTGASPVIARIAKELGILTVTVVTRPFKFEGPRRTKSALEGLEKLRDASDTMIVINNERLLEVVGPKVPMKEAFATADKVLSQAVASISALVTTPGLINVDFNDIRTIMGGRGGAVMGVGLGKGESRATEAVKKATSSPLLDKVVIDGATGVLICITGGPDMTLAEVSEATNLVAEAADPDAEIIFGAVIDESLTDSMRVTLIATGFSDELHRKRELEQAFKSAPLAPPSRMSLLDTPAPMEEDSIEDELDNNPIFQDTTPKSHPRRIEPERPKQSSLREALESMMEEDGESEAPRARRAEVQPPIRVARPRVNGGPAVRPASQPHASLEPRVKPQRHDEPAPSVPQYSPATAEEGSKEDDYDTPAFLRRRRSLFD